MPPIPRPWLQFRLRTLLIAILLLSLPLSWFAVRMRKARRQRAAVEAIERLGGYVAYDWETDWVVTPPARKSYPAWLRRPLGDDFFFDVVEASFLYSELDDEAATCLKGLANIEELYLDHTRITDAGLANIEGLTHLQKLTLDYTQITDTGLEHVAGLTPLRCLTIGGTRITDAGLDHLKRMSNLRYLHLDDTQVTDEGAKSLQAALPNCQISY